MNAFRVVDRRISYFERSALHRAMDATEFQRRYQKGLQFLAAMRRPRVIKTGANILTLKPSTTRARAIR